MSNHRGRFVWYELMTTDTEAAKGFYRHVTGWGVQAYKDGGYQMWTSGGASLGGLMTLPEDAKKMGAPPHWLAYVGVDDVDASTKQATELGGQVFVPPQDIPEIGRFSIIADPQGAVIALFKSEQAMPLPEGPAKPGRFSWHELVTSDAGAAWSFYSALFGWEKTEAMDMGGGNMYQMYGTGGVTLGGIFTKPPEMPAPPHWLYYVHVPDINEALAAVKANGGQVLSGPMEVPGGDLVAQCMDPQGAAFALHAKPKA